MRRLQLTGELFAMFQTGTTEICVVTFCIGKSRVLWDKIYLYFPEYILHKKSDLRQNSTYCESSLHVSFKRCELNSSGTNVLKDM